MLNIVTLLFHGRTSVPPRGTSSTRPSLLSPICGRSSLFLFRQEVIRLMIFRKQHCFLFHEKVIVAVFSLLLSASCFLLTRERVKSNLEKKKVKLVYVICTHLVGERHCESIVSLPRTRTQRNFSNQRPVSRKDQDLLYQHRHFYRVNL